jgi:hypothetical protein
MAEEDVDFSDEFCRFLQNNIPAVEAAELLFVYLRDPAREWAPADAIRALGPGVSEGDAQRYLAGFRDQLLLSTEAGASRYQPASAELDKHARTLERLYRQRPVTLIRVIYGLRDSKIQSFADAFRLRRR